MRNSMNSFGRSLGVVGRPAGATSKGKVAAPAVHRRERRTPSRCGRGHLDRSRGPSGPPLVRELSPQRSTENRTSELVPAAVGARSAVGRPTVGRPSRNDAAVCVRSGARRPDVVCERRERLRRTCTRARRRTSKPAISPAANSSMNTPESSTTTSTCRSWWSGPPGPRRPRTPMGTGCASSTLGSASASRLCPPERCQGTSSA